MAINHAEVLDGTGAVVEVRGPLDSYTGPDFENYIDTLLHKNIHFIFLDAANLKYISSEGIGLLLLLNKKISGANGFFILFSLSGEIATLLNLLGFDRIIRIAGSREDALKTLDRQIAMRKSGVREDRGATGGAAPVKATAVQEEAPAVMPEQPSESGVVECHSCRLPVRIAGDGAYLCPHCSAEFRILNQKIARAADESGRAKGADFAPLVVECAKCKSLIRIQKSGAYRCPDCGREFKVEDDQSVVF